MFSRLQLRLRKCCPRPARRGCRLEPPPAPRKDDNRHRSRREGGGGGAVGLETETSTHALRRGPSEAPSPDSRCVHRSGAPSPAAEPVPCGGGRGGAAQPPPTSTFPPHKPGPDSPAAGDGDAQLRGERGAMSPPRGAAARDAGAAAAGRRAPSPAGSWLSGGCSGRAGRGEGMRSGWGHWERRAERTPGATPSPSSLFSYSCRAASAARTGWTRFRAERRGPAARCIAPPPAADASVAAPPCLPPALWWPWGPRNPSLLGKRAGKGKAGREVLSPHPAPG